MKQELVYPDLSYAITGILFSAHNKLGRYRNEKQYCDFLEDGFRKGKILYEREKFIPPSFEGEYSGRSKVDFLVDGKIVLEIKAKRLLEKSDYFQLMRYLESFDKRLGILVNFRQKYLVPKRVLKGYKSGEGALVN